MKAQLIATFQATPPSQPCTFDGSLCCVSISGAPGSNYTPVLPYTCTIISPVGTFPYTHPCFNGLVAGNYTIQIQDAAGATGTVNATVPNSPNGLPPTTTVDVTPAGCSGGTGSACANVTGGSGSGFTYNWEMFDPPQTNFGTSSCASNMPVGHYTLTVHDIGIPLCYYYYDVYISVEVSEVNATTQAATCDAPCNGTILVDLTEATQPATISWSGTSSGSVSGISTDEYLLTGLCAGTYQITVDDASSCTPIVLSGLNIVLDNADIIISGCNNLVWNPDYFLGQTDVTLSGNLIIQPGACLTIEDMTIRLKPGKYIRILGTGSLTTTNTTYDAGCGNWWQGFEVGSLQPNSNSANRAFLNMSQNCVVTHAEVAISNFYSNGAPSTQSAGGRIEVVDCRFIDNNRDLTLNDYFPQGGLNALNRGAYFENCSFELNQYLPQTTSNSMIGRSMIELKNTADVRFFMCRAENFNPNYVTHTTIQLYKSFLQADFSSFSWDGCNPTQTNCNNSYVRGYIDGMECEGDLTISNPNLTNVFNGPEISHTLFECYRAIEIVNVAVARITDNTFRLFNFPNATLPPNYAWATNIQYPAPNPNQNNPAPTLGTEFLFAGNDIDFFLPVGGIGNLSPNVMAGIFVYNGGEHDSYIIENKFRGCNRAGQFDDRNKGSDGSGLNDALGLHYECNTLESCRYDFVIRDPQGSEGNDAGVYGFQRQTFPSIQNFSAGNKFNNSIYVSSPNDDISNSIPQTSAIHRYGYNSSELNANGTSEMSPTIQILTPMLGNGCNYNYQNWSADFVDQQQQAMLNYENTKEIYLALRDGGNTELIKGQVENSSINTSLSLYNDLMELSPDLSEEVLMSLISKEDEFPSTLLTLVLAANPVVPKSAKLLTALDNRSQPLSEYQMSIILQGMNEMRPLEVLELEMQGYRMEMEKSRNGLLHQLHGSSEPGNHLQTILNTYREDLFLSDCFSKADLLMRNGYFGEGLELLSTAPNNFHFDTEEKIGFDQYLQLLEVEHAILTRNDHSLTPEEIAYLLQVSDEEPCGYGKRAYHLLIVFAGYPDIEVECDFGDQPETRGLFHKLAKQETTIGYMTAYPNPVNGEVLLIELKSEDFDCGIIKIFSNDGRLLHTESINQNQTELLINAEILTSGLNQVCIFSVDGVLLQSNQIIKN